MTDRMRAGLVVAAMVSGLGLLAPDPAAAQDDTPPVPLDRFVGSLRAAEGLGLSRIGDETLGSLRATSLAPGVDLRVAPGEVVLTTPGGRLVAGPGFPSRVRFDPVSGLRLALDAPADASCPTGEEPDCWQPGMQDGVSVRLFEALCRFTLDFLPEHPDPCLPMGVSLVVGRSIGVLSGDVAEPLRPPPGGFPGQPAGIFLPIGEDAAGSGSTHDGGLDLLQSNPNPLLQLWPMPPRGSFLDGMGFGTGAADAPPPGRLPGEGCSFFTPQLCDLVTPPPVDGATDPAMRFVPPDGDLASASFDFLRQLVALSSGGDPSDPTRLDPDSPFASLRCSFANPEGCAAVTFLLSQVVQELPDDPDGPPPLRWLWQSGSEHPILAAEGSLAAFAGGTLHLGGPEVSRVVGTSVGAPVVLVPPPEAPQPLLSGSPLVQTGSAGPDGVSGSGDETSLGFAYAVTTLPEPGALLTGGAALLTLAGASALRRRT